MSTDSFLYEDLQHRADQAEAMLAAIHQGEVDLLIGDSGPMVIRMKSLLEAQERLQILLDILRRITRLIIHEDDSRQLLQSAVDCFCEGGLFHGAWIVKLNGSGGTDLIVRGNAIGLRYADGGLAAKNEFPYLEEIVASPGPVIIGDLQSRPDTLTLKEWSEESCLIGVSLNYDGHIYGALSILAPRSMAKDEDAHTLWAEIGGDLGFALYRIQDIAKRKQVEETLNKKIASLLQAEVLAQLGNFERNWQTGEGYWSEGFLKLLGIDEKSEAFSHKDFKQFIHPDDFERVTGHIRKTLSEHEPMNIEFRLVQAAGQIIHIHGTAENYYDLNDKPALTIGVFQDITNQVIAQKELVESERKLRAAQEMAHLGFWSQNVNSGEVEWSEEVFKILGLAPDTFTPQIDSILAFSWWPDGDGQGRLNEIINHAIETQTPGHYEQRFRRPDNSVGYFYSTFQGKFDKNGELDSIVGTMLDITERKQAETDLRVSELQFRNQANFLNAVIENSPFAMQVMDAKGVIIRANQALLNILNLTEDMIIGKYNVLHDENMNVQKLMPVVEAVFNELKSARFTMFWTGAKAGDVDLSIANEHWIDVSMFPITDEAGKLVNVVCQYVDITEQKNNEESLRESHEKYKSIVDNIGIGVALINPDMEVLEMNHQMREWFPEHDLDKRPICYRAFNNPPREEICDHCPTWRTLEDGNVYEDTTLTSHSGKTRSYRIVSSPLINSQGEVTAAIELVEDITDRLNLQAQLLQSQKMESVGTLAGGIAHDFNNILSVVLGFSELALCDVEKETQMEDNLKEVLKAGLRAKELVLQILTFARQSDEELKPIQVDFIIKEVLKFIRSSLPTSIEIKQNIASDALILGSSTQIHRIMMNLCTNAAHAMQAKGGILEIALKDVTIDQATMRGHNHLTPGNYIEIMVSDTGAGIEPQIIDKIFEPYFTTKGPSEGTGMGLAMVHGIIDSYNGKIFVESTLGVGTRFSMYLPSIKRKKSPLPDLLNELLTGRQERILVVDDEAPIAKILQRNLSRLGYSVTTRTSSLEALELFRSKPGDYDLVISDVTMPKLTGDRLTQKLIEIRPDIPVILCTGYSEKFSDKSASEIGIKAFANKPFVQADLAKTVRNVLDEAKDDA